MKKLLPFLFAFFVTTSALATPTAEEHEKARAFLADARQKRAAGDHAGALERFRNAHAIENLPTTGLEVGRTLLDLGRLVDARDVLLAVTKTTPQPDEPPPLPIARAEAARLAQSIETRLPTLKISLHGKIDPALSVTIDGVAVAPDLAVLPRKLDPGPHAIVARLGESEKKVDVTLSEGQEHEVALDVPQPQHVTTPIAPVAVPPPPPPAPRSHVLGYVGGGLAIAGTLTGSVLGAMAISKTNELRSVCEGQSCAPEWHDDLGSANTMATVSTISFVIAGVGAVLLVIDLVSSPSSASTARNYSHVTF